MIDRKQMILALTRYELQYIQDNPEYLQDVAVFFAEGGFNNHTNAQLIDLCRDNVWLDHTYLLPQIIKTNDGYMIEQTNGDYLHDKSGNNLWNTYTEAEAIITSSLGERQ